MVIVQMDSKEERARAAAAHQARFQKIVLSWDYLRLLSDSKVRQKQNERGVALKKVGTSFKDINEYISVFEPLIFEEVKAHIMRSEEEGTIEAEVAAAVTCEKTREFYTARIAVKCEVIEQFAENDLLLLSKDKIEDGSIPSSTHALAMVEGRDGRLVLKLQMFLDGEVDQSNVDQISPSSRLSEMLPILQETRTLMWVLKLASLSSILREYTALQSVGSLSFADVILSARSKSLNTDMNNRSWNIPKSLMDCLEINHNASQIEAIQAGLTHDPFVLIQGPPGTGKTQTILGLLGVVLHATSARVQFEINPMDSVTPTGGENGFYQRTGDEFKPEVVPVKEKHNVHVLVCAPSNSALDEIVLRLMTNGIRDGNGQVCHPSIVRVGLQADHSVRAMSMDYLVEQRLSCMVRPSTYSRSRVAAVARDTARAAILDEATIVFSTLSFSASGIFSHARRGFDVVIIDEAAQAVEPATLVPLAHGCRQVFLIGDPVQLPATVLSSTAEQFGYGTSLFKRFQENGYPVQMLRTQYRMHPQIREFPSREFYCKALEDGKDVLHQTKSAWHRYRCFGPFSFFDIEGTESQLTGGSWVNVEEVDLVVLLYQQLVTRYPELKVGSRISVISPYKQQVKLVQKRFCDVLGPKKLDFICFQGREKDVTIFSCVRANEGKGLGFVSDFRRMNVGITRARTSLLVVGSASTLMQDEHWSNLVKSAQDRNCLFKISTTYDSFFSDENLARMKTSDDE